MTHSPVTNVCYFFTVPVTIADLARLGVNTLRNRGIRVTVCDMSAVFYPEIRDRAWPVGIQGGPEVTVLRTREDVVRFVEARRRDLAILMLTLEKKSRFFYQLLKRFNVSYLQFYSDNIPTPPLSMKWAGVLRRGFRWRSIAYRVSTAFLRHLPSWVDSLQPPRFVLKAGRRYRPNCPAFNESTLMIGGHSQDYDLFLRRGKEGNDPPSWCVYLDEYFPFHRDLLLEGESLPFLDPGHYYKRLNLFFDHVEKTVSLPVVVAAHPRSRYDLMPDCFAGRRVDKGKTIDLVAQSRCVFTHFSTSINFAVLFKKPIFFLTSDEINTKRHADSIAAFAAEFDKKLINIDRNFPGFTPADWVVPEERYREYRENYIKETGTPEKALWDIVADRLIGT